jgi:hypothetical protein
MHFSPRSITPAVRRSPVTMVLGSIPGHAAAGFSQRPCFVAACDHSGLILTLPLVQAAGQPIQHIITISVVG